MLRKANPKTTKKWDKPLTQNFGTCPHLEPFSHRGLGLLQRPLQPEQRRNDLRWRKLMDEQDSKDEITTSRPYPIGRATLLSILRPVGLESPRVIAPGFSWASAGLGSMLPT